MESEGCPTDDSHDHMSFEFEPNSLSFYYPKQVSKHLIKKRSSNLDKLDAPTNTSASK